LAPAFAERSFYHLIVWRRCRACRRHLIRDILLNKYRFSRNLGVLLSFAFLAGCMQPPGVTGQARYEAPPQEESRTVATSDLHETERSPASPELPDQPSLQVENPLSQTADGAASPFGQIGVASYYAKKFQGRRTASGERYDLHALTAAHRTLPLGSYVRVTTISSARSVIVRINDRGPYTRGRMIDLSYAAAAALGLPRAGVLLVRVEPVTKQEAGA
jgi:rare lipoprotein A